MLDVAVLGPVQVRRDGELLRVPGGKTAELLVRLALEAGAPVRADRLLDDLWGGAPTNRNTLQQKVARLRRGLGDPAVLAAEADAYRLAVDPAAVDALRVLHLAAEAAARLEDGDPAGAARASREALALFRGEVLGTAGDWAQAHRARLGEARAKLEQTGFAARLRLGDDVVDELEAAVAVSPYREGLWELLITALYRAGRQADALAAYRRARARLADDLGLEPGPRLREVERQVLAQDAALAGPDGNLPALAPALVARAGETAALLDLLARHRLVEVVGPGGVGKTALALATGRRLGTVPVWLVRLEGARSADEVLDTVLAALGVVGREPALLERLHRAACVLVLDNCEHVADAAAALAERLLDAAPALRVLCTSQVALELPGEAVLELGPLALADAVELFTRRAAGPVDSEEVLALCRALDGLPLAIELAAARTRTLPVAEITRRLDDRFALLADPASRRPARRRALRATIAWSYDLLGPEDRRGLWALATFSGGAPLAAVEAVLAALAVPPAAAIDVLGRLAARSLVVVEAPARYRLLDSIRAFALEALDAAGAAGRAHAAHAAWFAERAAASTAGVRGADQAGHLAFARTERANLDAALAWCAAHDPGRGLALAAGFGWAWIVLGDARGAQRLHAALEAAGGRAPAPVRATALLRAAWIEASTGRLEPARRDIAAARALSADDGEPAGRCDYHLAYVVSHQGEWAEALALTAHAAARLRDPWEHAANALFASRAAISAGDEGRAGAARDEVERRLADVADPWLHVRCDAMLGELARVQRRFADAVAHLARAAETSGRLGFLQTEAYQLTSLGRAQCQAGDDAAGAATLALGVAKAAATGDVRLAALGRVHLGRVLRGLGRPEEARAALRAAAAFHREAGGGEQQTLGDTLLAALDGDRTRLEDLLALARGAGDAPAEVFALDALGRITGEPARFAEADRRMAVASHFVTERDRVDRRG